MFRPRTQPTCSDLNSSASVRRSLPTRLPGALSAKGHWTLATIPRSPLAAILDAASSISPVFATLTKNTRGWGVSRLLRPAWGQSPLACHDCPVHPEPARERSRSARIQRAANSFIINTYKTDTKQTTLTTRRINTYEKTGGRGHYRLLAWDSQSWLSSFMFQGQGARVTDHLCSACLRVPRASAFSVPSPSVFKPAALARASGACENDSANHCVRRLAPLAHISPALSSRGLGHRPLKAETRVRIPLALPNFLSPSPLAR